MKIYITRHGQTEWNIAHRMQGWQDSPLTQKGIDNAKSLAKHLKGIKFDGVYSSSSNRALHTAELVSGFDRNSIIACDQLREICLGEWEGRQHSEIETSYPKEYNDFWKAPHLYSRKDAESFYDVQKRALELIDSLILEYKNTDKNFLIATHTVTLKTIMAHFENRSFDKLWDPPYIYDTSLSMVEITADGTSILLHGDISHLECEEEC